MKFKLMKGTKEYEETFGSEFHIKIDVKSQEGDLSHREDDTPTKVGDCTYFGSQLDKHDEVGNADHFLLFKCNDQYGHDYKNVSRRQFRLTRVSTGWTLQGPEPGRRASWVQLWGSAEKRRVIGNETVHINPGSRACCFVETESAFYWLLLHNPDEEHPSQISTGDETRRITNPAAKLEIDLDRSDENIGKRAAIYMFHEFLSWPMHPYAMVRTFPTDEMVIWDNEELKSSALKARAQTLATKLHEKTQSRDRTANKMDLSFFLELAQNGFLEFDQLSVRFSNRPIKKTEHY